MQKVPLKAEELRIGNFGQGAKISGWVILVIILIVIAIIAAVIYKAKKANK